MKVFSYFIRNTGETANFSSLDKMHEYLVHWHLTESEADILTNTAIYNHENMGIIVTNCSDLDPYFEVA